MTNTLKYAMILLVLALSGCIEAQSEGSKTWKRKWKIGSMPHEVVGAVLGNNRPPGPVETQSSWTPENMPNHWR